MEIRVKKPELKMAYATMCMEAREVFAEVVMEMLQVKGAFYYTIRDNSMSNKEIVVSHENISGDNQDSFRIEGIDLDTMWYIMTKLVN